MEAHIVGTDHQQAAAARLRVLRFVAVGGTAALVHFCVAVSAVRWAGAPPLAANVAGWGVAFAVSFSGHYFLTFADAKAPLRRSLARFALVSAGAFAVNEAAYALVLRSGRLRYDVALAGVLLGVAIVTYLLSRRWAFLRS